MKIKKERKEKRRRKTNNKMSKRKACLTCRVIFDGEKCPICGENETTENWKGKVYVFNSEKSEVAKNMKIKKNGEYTIKAK